MENLVLILIYIIAGIGFVGIGLLTAKLLQPSKPNDEKLSSYECGEEVVGGVWNKFNSRFYVIALIFVLFEIELIFLFPLATVFGSKLLIDKTSGVWGYFALIEIGVFVFLLILGLAFAWANGYIDWIKPDPKIEDIASEVPENLYQNLNQKYAQKASK